MTTTEAAARLGVNQSRVRQLLLAKELHGEKIGRDWHITAAEVARFARERRGPGRPKQRTTEEDKT